MSRTRSKGHVSAEAPVPTRSTPRKRKRAQEEADETSSAVHTNNLQTNGHAGKTRSSNDNTALGASEHSKGSRREVDNSTDEPTTKDRKGIAIKSEDDEEVKEATPKRKRKLAIVESEEERDIGVRQLSDDAFIVRDKRSTKSQRSKQEKAASSDNTAKHTRKRKSKAEVKAEVAEEREDTDVQKEQNSEEHPKPKRKRSTKAEKEAEASRSANEDGKTREPVKPKRKRKTKEEREREAMPLASRTPNLKMYVGAHVSIAKGLENAVTNILHVGGNAFALFLKSQRKWENPSLQDANRDAFVKGCTEHKYDGMSHVVPHGSYLVNLATEDKKKSVQSYDTFLDDLHRCEALGIKYYNFHPGAAGKSSMSDAIARLGGNLNRALAETSTVVPLLENMAGHGSIIGGRFSDLASVISHIKPEYKHRIGVCLDTCHSFAAGYDLRTPSSFAAVMSDFDSTVGLQYLKALHINDSKAPFHSHRDLHQNIGLGFLGLRAFHNIMNEPRFHNLPLILETPLERPDPNDPTGKKTVDDKSVWAREIKLLEGLIGMDPDATEFKTLEKDLAEQGRESREKHQRSFDEKVEKARKRLEKEKQKSIKDMFARKDKKIKGSSAGVASAEFSESEVLSELSDLSDSTDEEGPGGGKGLQ